MERTLQSRQRSLDRRKNLVDMLSKNAQEPLSPGKMVGGWYVPTSKWQGANKILQSAIAAYGMYKGGKDQDTLDKDVAKGRQGATDALMGAMTKRTPGPSDWNALMPDQRETLRSENITQPFLSNDAAIDAQDQGNLQALNRPLDQLPMLKEDMSSIRDQRAGLNDPGVGSLQEMTGNAGIPTEEVGAAKYALPETDATGNSPMPVQPYQGIPMALDQNAEIPQAGRDALSTGPSNQDLQQAFMQFIADPNATKEMKSMVLGQLMFNMKSNTISKTDLMKDQTSRDIAAGKSSALAGANSLKSDFKGREVDVKEGALAVKQRNSVLNEDGTLNENRFKRDAALARIRGNLASGVKLQAGEKYDEKTGKVTAVKGSKLWFQQKEEYAKDYNAMLFTDEKLTAANAGIDDILSKENAEGFNGNFGGGHSGQLTQFFPGSQKVKALLENLQSNLKGAGLEMMRQTGSIGSMVKEEWRIVAGMIAEVNPSLKEGDARALIGKIKTRLAGINALTRHTYENQWEDTQYYPKEDATKPSPQDSAPSSVGTRRRFDIDGNEINDGT